MTVSPPDPHASVAAAMSGLENLERRPLSEQVDVFERIHAALGEALADEATDGA